MTFPSRGQAFIAHIARLRALYMMSTEFSASAFIQYNSASQALDKSLGCASVEYGMKYWLNGEDYADINNAMVESLEPYKAEICPRLKKKAKEKKLGEIERLKNEVEGLK